MSDAEDTQTRFQVVINDEEQYSIWPADRELPSGWRAEGKPRTKDECLDHIEKVWTDMRPLSLRREMENTPPPEEEPTAEAEPMGREPLVDRLCSGLHAVKAVLRDANEVATARAELKRRIQDGYVLVRFTETQGGTDLGLRFDPGAVDLSGTDFNQGTGSVSLKGDLTLDFVPVCCSVQIELSTLTGQGGLKRQSVSSS